MTFIKIDKVKGIEYATIVQSMNINGKRRHKKIKYLGRYDKLIEKLGSNEPLVALSDISLEKSKEYGSVMVASKICEMLNLKEIINKYAKKRNGIDSGTLIEILAINRSINPKSKHKISDWYEKTVLPFVYNIPSKKLNPQVLCEVLDKPDTGAIFNIHRDLNKIIEEKFNIDMSSVIYDITSTYFEGEKCLLAKFGYSRDHRGDKKQIIIGIVISLDGGVPIYHFVKAGNTADVSTQIDTSTKLKELGVKNACVIHDRGMVSKWNLRTSDKLNLSYITALDSGTKHSDYWIDNLKTQEFMVVDQTKERTIIDNGELNEVTFITKITEKIVKEHKRLKKYVLVHSEELAKLKETKRTNKIQKADAELNSIANKVNKGVFKKKITAYSQIKTAITGLTKYFEINIKEDENVITEVKWEIKKDVIDKTKLNDGYFVLISSDSNKPQLEVFSAFKYKCEIEAVIREIKELIDLHPIRHWKNMRPEAQVFICILGYLIRKILKIIMNQNKIYDSVSCIMDYLEEIKTIEIKVEGQTIMKNTKAPKEIKELLEILHLNPEI